MYRLFLLLIITLLTSDTTVVLARVRDIELNLSVKNLNPDCFTQGYDVLLVNGQHPAPPIRVTKNDEVRITVRNHAEDPNRATSVHYHGIFQIGTPEADGMPNVTQTPIPPGGVYYQNFRVTGQAGTYFYHAHSFLQDDAVHGPFIVYESDEDWPSDDDSDGDDNKKLREGPYEYDGERVLLFSEWWHQEEQARLDYMMGPSFAGMIDADSHLVNGRTVYDPAQRENEKCEGYSAIDVEPGKVYRLRVIGASTFSGMGFSIAQHKMTIIETDGNLIQPYETDFVHVAPGQRFSVLFKTDQAPESYYINTQAYFNINDRSNAVSILRYKDHHEKHSNDNDNEIKPKMFKPHAWEASVPDMPTLPAPDAPQNQEWIFPRFQPVIAEDHDFTSAPDRTVVLKPIEETMPDGTRRWIINGNMMPEWKTSLLQELQEMRHMELNYTAMATNHQGLSGGYDDGHQTYPLKVGEVVDFVIHASVLMDQGICASHPWHTHGMVHYAIANGPGEYNHSKDKDIRTYPTPTAKDTSVVYAYPPEAGAQPGDLCGWSKVRLIVSNPGVWGFHCHITGHMLQGMMTVLEVSPEQVPILQK